MTFAVITQLSLVNYHRCSVEEIKHYSESEESVSFLDKLHYDIQARVYTINNISIRLTEEPETIYHVRVKDDLQDNDISIEIYPKCVKGHCDCKHFINDVYSQLKPYCFFVEIFLKGQVDDEW